MNKLGPLPARTDRRAQLSAPRRAVLDLLVERQEDLTVTQVAQTLGQHPNTVREHLEALTRSGLARRASLPPVGRGRPASVYSYAPEASFTSPEYAVLAKVLVSYLARSFPDGPSLRHHSRQAGHAWGREIIARDRQLGPAGGEDADPDRARARQAALTRLTRMLTDGGFDPVTEHTEGRTTVRLYRCPVLELAQERPEVVCSAHLGMAREILATGGVEPGQVSLEAFAEAGACLLHVAAAAGELPAERAADALRIGPA